MFSFCPTYGVRPCHHKRLEMSLFGVSETRSQTTDTRTCAICLGALVSFVPHSHSLVPLETLPCGHRFHASCADGWFRTRTTCPTCRAPAREPRRVRLPASTHRATVVAFLQRVRASLTTVIRNAQERMLTEGDEWIVRQKLIDVHVEDLPEIYESNGQEYGFDAIFFRNEVEPGFFEDVTYTLDVEIKVFSDSLRWGEEGMDSFVFLIGNDADIHGGVLDARLTVDFWDNVQRTLERFLVSTF